MVLIFKSFWLKLLNIALLIHTAIGTWHYDARSCAPHVAMLNRDMTEAFRMIEAAVVAIGQAPQVNAGNALWLFPDTETRDLVGRIFGGLNVATTITELQSLEDRYQVIKNTFQYILQNYRNQDAQGNLQSDSPGLPAVDHHVGDTDILLYCDMNRLIPVPGSKTGEHYVQGGSPETRWPGDQYKACKEHKWLQMSTIIATTSRPFAPNPVFIQICPPTIIKHTGAPTSIQKMADVYDGSKQTQKNLIRVKGKLPLPRQNLIDFFAMLDLTLVHEMTHAVPKSWPAQLQQRTQDGVDIGPGKGYEWRNIRKQPPENSWKVSDSLAYFALGARMLEQRAYKITNNGYPAEVDNYIWPGITPNPANMVLVDRTWGGPRAKRDTEEIQNVTDSEQPTLALHHLVPRGTKPVMSPLYPRQIANGSVTWATSGSSGLSGGNTPSVTPIFTSGGIIGTSAIPPSLTLSSRTFIYNSSKINTSSHTNGINTATHITNPSASTTLSAGTKLSNTHPASTTINNLTGNNSSTSGSLQTASIPGSTTSINSSIAGFVPTIASSTRGPELSSLLSSFWHPTTTLEPTSTPIAGAFCVSESLVDCVLPIGYHLEKLVIRKDIEIPEVTDISLFPVLKVKKGNLPEIPFVKMELPSDKCNPLPKPSAKEFLGVVLNVAQKAVDTVLDAACHISFPVINGDFPKGLDFSWFPHPDSFPPPPIVPPPNEPVNSEPTTTKDPDPTSSNPSSSTSCRATAVPSCDVTNIISANVTQTSITSCTTTTACSGIGITEVTGITSTCTQTAILSCRGTAFVSGTETTSFTTDCSTISACSGTGITSVTTSTASPNQSGAMIIHLEPEPNWFKKQACVLSLLANASTTIVDTNVWSCYGETTMAASSDDAATTDISSSQQQECMMSVLRNAETEVDDANLALTCLGKTLSATSTPSPIPATMTNASTSTAEKQTLLLPSASPTHSSASATSSSEVGPTPTEDPVSYICYPNTSDSNICECKPVQCMGKYPPGNCAAQSKSIPVGDRCEAGCASCEYS
ncbi:hypothetical protein K458DRAFT_326513 [Lentithecium fluviatile CBS 122367]|uniref:Lysine-specific metallo-endopeptidase domain-containing protein n=1 Tax=Lentithecium fluviatile CBS 122367 TaxID=1168545 RepID=A0A6G1JKF3_9PLEO|nr:hypothetical protein K458DRAFT_326513 [Lentithecium fluviatile CBS 122367]